jgi:predicted ATP-grasp superfamily ATP-dependent carboligase
MVAQTVDLVDGIRAANYHGPISIHSRLLHACSEAGVQAVSLWGHVPVYLQYNPWLVIKLVKILNEVVGMQCPVEPLKRQSIELDRRINEALAQDSNLKQFVETIEGREDTRAQDGRNDNIIRLNDFLRRETRIDPEA